jgi:uncharacterized protein (TIGR00730 family)
MTQTTNAARTIRRVCVFAGSNRGHAAPFADAARALGREIFARGWGAVYGGGSVGLMGVLADEVLRAGGEVIGVIPEMLATKELLHTGVTKMHVVPSMHARKALMAELADAFIALPGGYGTFEETLEIITWGQLGIHRKPIGLLNVDGFYNPLVEFFDHAIAAGFIRPEQRDLWIIANEPGPLLDRLTRHELPAVRKWIRTDET